MTAEDIDWQTRTITYFRMKTGSRAQFTISKKLETVLQPVADHRRIVPEPVHSSRPTTGQAGFAAVANGRACTGVTLHSYRYAWAERAKVVGMPERFAQAALGHNSKAIHRAYAKKAQIIVPSLEEYETKAATATAGLQMAKAN